jgi:hypothetical protein
MIGMRRIVSGAHGDGKRLAKLFGCSEQMVTYALHFKKNSLLARKIRKAAMERGGVDISAALSGMEGEVREVREVNGYRKDLKT